MVGLSTGEAYHLGCWQNAEPRPVGYVSWEVLWGEPAEETRGETRIPTILLLGLNGSVTQAVEREALARSIRAHIVTCSNVPHDRADLEGTPQGLIGAMIGAMGARIAQNRHIASWASGPFQIPGNRTVRRLLLAEKTLGTHWSPGAQPFIRIIIRRQPSAIIGCVVKEQDAQVVRDALARLRAQAGTAFAFAVAEIKHRPDEMEVEGYDQASTEIQFMIREQRIQNRAGGGDGGMIGWRPLRASGEPSTHAYGGLTERYGGTGVKTGTW